MNINVDNHPNVVKIRRRHRLLQEYEAGRGQIVMRDLAEKHGKKYHFIQEQLSKARTEVLCGFVVYEEEINDD